MLGVQGHAPCLRKPEDLLEPGGEFEVKCWIHCDGA